MTLAVLQEQRPSRFDRSASHDVPKPAVKVLHIINGQHYAGAERVQDLLALELKLLGFEVGFACLKPGAFPQVRQAQEAPLHKTPMRHKFDLRPVRQLVGIVRREGYQLLHAHTARSALIAGLVSRITGVPLIYHVHSPAGRESTHRWRNWLNARIERLSLQRVSALIAVSNSLCRYVGSRGFARQSTWTVPNGVPCRPAVAPRDRTRKDWILGTVALFRPRKGVEVLLHALAQVRSEGFDVRLRAVGGFETPQYEQQIKRLASDLGLEQAIDWCGFRQEIDRELARMDLFVLPSLFGEGLPMVVLEAMAAGLPVVATRVEGIPEAIRDGQDGLLAEPNDPQHLAAVMRRLMTGEVDPGCLAASARKRQAEAFSQQSMATGVARVYRAVLCPAS